MPRKITLIAIVGLLTLAWSAIRPADADTASSVSFFESIAGSQHLVGQMGAYGTGETIEAAHQRMEDIFHLTGDYPALVGMDYWRADLSLSDSIVEANDFLIEWAGRGAYTTISIHFENPFTYGRPSDLTGNNRLDELLNPSTAAGSQWLQWLDTIAVGLQELETAGVQVMWRPLHEMNGGWFWWTPRFGSNGQPQPAQFVNLWRHMHDYFTNVKGLSNLIWVYAPNVGSNVTDYYPGNQYVDVVGLDKYVKLTEQRLELAGYSELVTLDKPIYLSEFGPRPASTDLSGIQAYDYSQLIAHVQDDYPALFAVFNWEWIWALNYSEDINQREYVESPRTLSLSDIAVSGTPPTATATATLTPSRTPTATNTPSRTPTATNTLTPTRTITPTATATPSRTPTVTNTPMATATVTDAPAIVPGLSADFYEGIGFERYLLSRIDSAINFNWRKGAPQADVPSDRFSVRWTGYVIPRYSQTYTFYTRSDDGARLWINGQQLINNWSSPSLMEISGRITLTAGQYYPIVLEYYENTQSAIMQLRWSSTSQSKQLIPSGRFAHSVSEPAALLMANDTTAPTSTNSPTPTNTATVVPTATLTATAVVPEGGASGLSAEYYSGMAFETLVLTRTDPVVDFNWRSGSPDPLLPSNRFSVRWTGYVVPQYSQTYTFYTASDDGIRLWVNGQQLVNNWTAHSLTENSGQIALTAGQSYRIVLEYYENSGSAAAMLRWSSASQSKQIVPATQLSVASAGGAQAAPQVLSLSRALATPAPTATASAMTSAMAMAPTMMSSPQPPPTLTPVLAPGLLLASAPACEGASQAPGVWQQATQITFGYIGGMPWTAGARFCNVPLPAGAQVVSAWVEFVAAASGSEPIVVELAVEDNVNTAAFSEANSPSARLRAPGVPWPVEAWQAGSIYRSPDIVARIASIVGQPDWYIGNALSVVLSPYAGQGSRSAWVSNGSTGGNTRLMIAYRFEPQAASEAVVLPAAPATPTLTPVTPTLLQQQANTVNLPANVVSQSYTPCQSAADDTTVYVSGSSLPIGYSASGAWTTALRFCNVSLPADAQIEAAWLDLTAAENGAGTLLIDAALDASVHSAAYDLAALPSMRTRTSGLPWDVSLWEAGRTYRLASLGLLLQSVDSAEWQSGRDLSLLLHPASGGGQRLFVTESEMPDALPRLTIHYTTGVGPTPVVSTAQPTVTTATPASDALTLEPRPTDEAGVVASASPEPELASTPNPVETASVDPTATAPAATALPPTQLPTEAPMPTLLPTDAPPASPAVEPTLTTIPTEVPQEIPPEVQSEGASGDDTA